MADETAKLTIKVDSTSANKATAELDKLTASSARAEAATESLGETDKQRTQRIREMIQASLGQQKAMGGIVESERSLAERRKQTNTATATAEALTRKEAEAFNAAVKAKQASMTRLNVAMKGNLATTAGMAEADAALDAAMATGAITAKEQEAYIKKLAAAEGLETATTEASTAAHIENAAAVKLNSRAYSEIGTAVSEIAAGNFGRLRRTGSAFLNQAGFFQKLFTPKGLSITGGVASVVALALAYKNATDANADLTAAIIKTGNVSGVTAAQVKAMALSLNGISHNGAVQVLTQITASGQVAADQFQEVGQAAINLAQVTDSSVEDATSKILEMMKSPAKGAREFDSALHFLTTSQMQEIAHLDNMGDHTAAATKLLDALSASVESTAKQIKQSMPWYDRLIDLEKRSFSNLFSSLGNALIPASQKSPIQQYLDAKRAYQKTIDEYKRDQALVQGGDLPAGALGPDRARVDRAYQYAISLYHKYNIAQVQSDNAIKGVQSQIQQEGKDAILTLQKLGVSLDGVATKQQKVNKAAEALYKIYRAGGKLPPGVNFNGPLADKPEGPGWEKIKKKLLADHKKHATMADLQDSIAKIVLKNGSAAEKAAEQATGKEAKRTASSFAYQQQLQSLMATQKEQYALQENSLGLSDQEIQKRQEMIRLDQEYNRELSRITRDHTRGQINDQQYHDQISALNDYYSQMQTITEDHFKRMDTARQSWLTGLTRGLAQVRDNGLNQAAQMTDAVTQGFNGLSDAVVQFAQTGKLSLSSFATNFVSMMIRMEEAALAAKAANAVLGWLTGPSYTNSYASAGTDVSGGNISFISGITKNANGGVYDSPSLAAYENQILSKPTLFRFANGGALGVAGEAAGESEAIMPLAKTSNGKLGVQLVGNQSQDIELQINITNKGQPAQARQTGMQRNGKKIMVDLMLDAVAGDVAKGGKTAKAMQQRFGLQRAGVPVGG